MFSCGIVLPSFWFSFLGKRNNRHYQTTINRRKCVKCEYSNHNYSFHLSSGQNDGISDPQHLWTYRASKWMIEKRRECILDVVVTVPGFESQQREKVITGIYCFSSLFPIYTSNVVHCIWNNANRWLNLCTVHDDWWQIGLRCCPLKRMLCERKEWTCETRREE